MNLSPLTIIILVPFLAALGLVWVPSHRRAAIRIVAITSCFLTMVLAVLLFLQFPTGSDGIHFEQQTNWIPALGISYHVGVDGLNVGLILMAAIVGFAAACASWEIKTREKEFFLLLLIMLGGVLGAFSSYDLFFFYCFHELALVPTFIMIGVWGRGERKNYAAFQVTVYLSAGALLVLAGLIALYWQAGAGTFDLVRLLEIVEKKPLSVTAQHYVFPLLLFGFGILVSLWPLHSWAPLAYASAPAPTAMLHAGVLKKFGLYGLLRIAWPLLPQGAQSWMPVLVWLCLGNILYCGLVAMRQRDLNFLLGNSSVAHMGFAFLGLASLNLIGFTGAVMVMIAHGFLAALSFALSGYLYAQTGTLQMDELGGLLRRLPFIGTALVMAMFAGCGLPGFANFVGELLVCFGAWKAWPLATGLALWGAMIIAAVYMLRAIRCILHGPAPEKWVRITDAANPWRQAPYLLLLACLLLFGCFPRLLTDKIKPPTVKVVNACNLSP
jgi:NADH-quinone oxidoreductase subunit M